MTESPRGLPVKETIRLKSVRKVMAKTMKDSVDTAALSQIAREVDVTALQELRQTSSGGGQAKVSLNTLIMAAIARTLPQHPMLNAELVDREILVYDAVNLGMAVATPDGLVVVVVQNADTQSVGEIATAIDSLAERARNGDLSMKDVEGGTFTVSNLGMFGIDGGFPLPRSPEGAILLVGAARAKPAVVDDTIAIRQIAQFNLTFDHRFIDGATAAKFLQDLNEQIENPDVLVQET